MRENLGIMYYICTYACNLMYMGMHVCMHVCSNPVYPSYSRANPFRTAPRIGRNGSPYWKAKMFQKAYEECSKAHRDSVTSGGSSSYQPWVDWERTVPRRIKRTGLQAPTPRSRSLSYRGAWMKEQRGWFRARWRYPGSPIWLN